MNVDELIEKLKELQEQNHGKSVVFLAHRKYVSTVSHILKDKEVVEIEIDNQRGEVYFIGREYF